jgi:hypothetical protein
VDRLGTVEIDVHTFRSADRPVHWRKPSRPHPPHRWLRGLGDEWFCEDRNCVIQRKFHIVELNDFFNSCSHYEFGGADNDCGEFGIDTRSACSAFSRRPAIASG